MKRKAHVMNSRLHYRDWRDTSWGSIAAVQNGLEKGMHAQRATLFGANLIDIEGKSTVSLLIDEVRSEVIDRPCIS